MIRNGILLHVYHLEAKGWEGLVWGNPDSDMFGTLTQFAYTLLGIPANEHVSSVIYSGPSSMGGYSEGEYTKRFLLERMNELSNFPSLKKIMSQLPAEEHEVFRQRIQDLVVGPIIKNTLDEVSHAALFFNGDNSVDRVYQIAAASHAPRCLQNQLIVRRSNGIPTHQPWYVVASDMGFSATEPDDLVILEPPHRGDDPMLHHSPALAHVVKPYFTLETKDKQQLIKTIQDFVAQRDK